MTYAGCALLLLFFIALRAAAGTWTGDFWSHAAAAHEIAARPFAPHHPELPLDTPGAFLTPHAVLVGWIARLTGVEPVSALAASGVVNVLLLLFGLRLYVGRLCLFPARTACLALVFMLVLWGEAPWVWSAFFHLEALPFVAPYPSTFSAGLMLVLLAVHARWLKRSSTFRHEAASPWSGRSSDRPSISDGGSDGPPLLRLGCGAGLLLLNHPVTAMALGIGLMAQAFGLRGERAWRHRGLLILAMVAVATVVAALWPFYPFFTVLTERGDYDAANTEMYVDAWSRMWPSLVLGVPALLLRLRHNHRDPLAWMVIVMGALYVAGGLTGRFTFGRLVSFTALFLQIASAEALVSVVASSRLRQTWRVPSTVAAGAVFAAALWLNVDRLALALSERPDWTAPYHELSNYVGHDEVVLAPLFDGYPVPSFAGKVVSSPGPLPLIADAGERSGDVEQFFSVDAGRAERLALLRKHGVRWLLLRTNDPDHSSLAESLSEEVAVVHRGEELTLCRVRELGLLSEVQSNDPRGCARLDDEEVVELDVADGDWARDAKRAQHFGDGVRVTNHQRCAVDILQSRHQGSGVSRVKDHRGDRPCLGQRRGGLLRAHEPGDEDGAHIGIPEHVRQ